MNNSGLGNKNRIASFLKRGFYFVHIIVPFVQKKKNLSKNMI